MLNFSTRIVHFFIIVTRGFHVLVHTSGCAFGCSFSDSLSFAQVLCEQVAFSSNELPLYFSLKKPVSFLKGQSTLMIILLPINQEAKLEI